MLSCVLNSDSAIKINITVMRIFVQLRQLLALNKELSNRLNEPERPQMGFRIEEFIKNRGQNVKICNYISVNFIEYQYGF